jgi:TatD DNase family protein
MCLFDAHLHLRDDRLWPYLARMFEAMDNVGIKGYLDCASHPKEWVRIPTPPSHFKAFSAYGVHPWFAQDISHTHLQRLEAILSSQPQACIGEIGLDGLRPTTHAQRDAQRTLLIDQLELAARWQRPVILHGARAWQPLFDALLPFATRLPAFLFHGVNFSPEALTHPLFKSEANLFFSLSTRFLDPRATKLHRLALALPHDRLLLETDAPDGLPFGAKGLIETTRLQHPATLRALKEKLEAHLSRRLTSKIPEFLLF